MSSDILWQVIYYCRRTQSLMTSINGALSIGTSRLPFIIPEIVTQPIRTSHDSENTANSVIYPCQQLVSTRGNKPMGNCLTCVGHWEESEKNFTSLHCTPSMITETNKMELILIFVAKSGTQTPMSCAKTMQPQSQNLSFRAPFGAYLGIIWPKMTRAQDKCQNNWVLKSYLQEYFRT